MQPDQQPFTPFAGFVVTLDDGRELRLSAAETTARVKIEIDDDPRCRPQRWGFAPGSATFFTLPNVSMLERLKYLRKLA